MTPGFGVVGQDRAGSWVVGVAPLRVVEQCSSCKRLLDSSMFRPLARACRPCEQLSEGCGEPETQHRDQEPQPSGLNGHDAPQKPLSAPPYARARFRAPETAVNRPPTAPETRKSANSDPGGVPERRRTRSKGSFRRDRCEPTTAATQTCSYPIPTLNARADFEPGPSVQGLGQPPPHHITHSTPAPDQENRPHDQR